MAMVFKKKTETSSAQKYAERIARQREKQEQYNRDKAGEEREREEARQNRQFTAADFKEGTESQHLQLYVDKIREQEQQRNEAFGVRSKLGAFEVAKRAERGAAFRVAREARDKEQKQIELILKELDNPRRRKQADDDWRRQSLLNRLAEIRRAREALEHEYEAWKKSLE